MAHPSVVINGIQYPTVPSVQIPKAGGGTATFWDATDATVTAGAMLNGVKGIGSNGEVTGNIQSKAAASYRPSSSDQSIAASQYLSGAQTIKAVTTTNLLPQYIANGVTVKVGCADDDDSVTSVVGTLASPTITQDSTSKILSIS